MTITHECGHVIGGMAGGATLTSFDLAPWRMPYSMHSPDPHPLVTLWAGPLIGVAVPLATASIAGKRWVWFIADFCLMANGGYLALAWLSSDRFLDTPRLLNAVRIRHRLLYFACCRLALATFGSVLTAFTTLHRHRRAENQALHPIRREPGPVAETAIRQFQEKRPDVMITVGLMSKSSYRDYPRLND